MTVLVLAVMSWIEKKLAAATHAAFYVLLFAMLLTGWLISSANDYSVSWFGLFTWPNLIGKNESAFDALREIHDVLSWLLLGLAIHVRAAGRRGIQGSIPPLRGND